MDPRLAGWPDSSFNLENDIIFSRFQQSLQVPTDDDPSALHSMGVPMTAQNLEFSTFVPSAEVDSPDEHDSDAVLKYINQILMEENINDEPSMFHDPIALKAAEKSFCEALGQIDPPSPHQSPVYVNHKAGSNNMNAEMESSLNVNLVQNMLNDPESILQFKRGVEEASKFLPSGNLLHPNTNELNRDHSPVFSGKKHHYSDTNNESEEKRSSKQLAVYVEDELSEVFDSVLLCEDPIACELNIELPYEAARRLQQNSSNGGKIRARKQQGDQESEAVDLRTLLISCAQSIASNDHRLAYEQLKQIRQQSSPNGDAYQRLAIIFANALEARLTGTGLQLYATLLSPKRITAAEKLQAFQVYMSACPFKYISNFFANKTIHNASSQAKTLHVIDFGILYGFQWPVLIQHLSYRPGGPPKLRITGIDLPQPGFRPAERVEETGRRLAKYCERFGVPFEYNAIATQNWETIKITDLKLGSGEFVAVNTIFRFKNLLDETVVDRNPRDAVLNLIRKINPNIFVQAVINGSYSSPFFVTRFKEALFNYCALYDMLDATLSRDDQKRFHFEQEFYGREAMNVIACEGLERVERPETYKQWQRRNTRAGFKILPLNQELVKKLRGKVKARYHKDFVFDENGNWVLQGWRGRILCASSCWVPQFR